ncbi:signal recognition particle, SRP9/SRP14 subunit [Pholiota conissans]|uniref:Signal recognition particle subunit SRP14 n=1 Tax=Pholiota conissans TaxID=109636 RepID=A0A9P5YPZ0_9AGAR|nr:signal recognition particle, SRP9/SRP14 subunit [Pholiota conissans]
MTLVDHDTFLKNLTALFESTKDHGSIWLTHKRQEPQSDTQEFPCLVRVTDGKTTKFATKVESSELIKFQAHYGALLKASMLTLRKRDKKREKLRAEEAAKRKKKMTEPVMLNSSKRGKGRRQYQRKLRALQKQEESQAKFQEREASAKQKSETIV